MFDRLLKLLILVAIACFPASPALGFTIIQAPQCPPDIVIDIPPPPTERDA